jgi:3'-phosphoadenosine 5'-phosphosulfate sulfotransferase (PAPS reductase)/FAD synthetase
VRRVSNSSHDESESLERATPREILEWAVARFGDRLLFTSSFGAGSGVLLHLWSEVARGLPVIFVDTGFLFPETLAYRDRIVDALGLELQIVRPAVSRDEFLRENGSNVYEFNPDLLRSQQGRAAPAAPRDSARVDLGASSGPEHRAREHTDSPRDDE